MWIIQLLIVCVYILEPFGDLKILFYFILYYIILF